MGLLAKERKLFNYTSHSMLQVLLAAANNAFVIFLSADIMALVLSIGSLYFEEREREREEKKLLRAIRLGKKILPNTFIIMPREYFCLVVQSHCRHLMMLLPVYSPENAACQAD